MKNNKCPICTGQQTLSSTTFTVDLGFGVVVVRHVPAQICEHCGAEWFDDATAEQLENIVNQAKIKHSMIEVSEYKNSINQAIAS